MVGCCCTPHESGKEIFVPTHFRRCTDCIILIPFLLTLIAMIVVAVVSIVGGNPDHFIYPTDYLGQSCGKPGTDLEHLGKGFFPRLDQDIQSQLGTLASGAIWNFKPYTLCVASCPSAFGLDNTQSYGGLSYPGASNSTSHDTFYSAFETVGIARWGCRREY